MTIVFTDADCVVQKDWLRNIHGCIKASARILSWGVTSSTMADLQY